MKLRVHRLIEHASLAAALALCAAAAAALVAFAAPGAKPATAADPGTARETPFRVRTFNARQHGDWIGNGIAYGPHRDGQSPTGKQPTREQLTEDLKLLAARWKLVRIYGAGATAEDIASIIRAEHLPLRLMLGAWVAVTERRDANGAVVESFPAARAANRSELESAVRLARAYPGIVNAICGGNETQVSWSDHRVPVDSLIAAIRWVRARTSVPVTTADDFNFWNKPESNAVAAEVDFIVMHAHPMWNGKQIGEALDWTTKTWESIHMAHTGRQVVLGETGWATRVGTEGDQAKLIKGHPGEPEQATFLREIVDWCDRTGTVTYFFEAFDENWKGGSQPAEVEKHWGVFRADRSPKLAVAPSH